MFEVNRRRQHSRFEHQPIQKSFLHVKMLATTQLTFLHRQLHFVFDNCAKYQYLANEQVETICVVCKIDGAVVKLILYTKKSKCEFAAIYDGSIFSIAESNNTISYGFRHYYKCKKMFD
jgi:hypothetical protein